MEGLSKHLVLPCVLLKPMAAQADPSHNQEPTILRQEIVATLVVANANDPVGESTLMGAGIQTADQSGRGLLEVEEQLLGTIALLNALEGVEIQQRARSMIRAEMVERLGYVCGRDYLFEADLGVERAYEQAGPLTASVAGATVTLAWTLPTERFDFVQAILRRASGATAPTSPTGGTGITLTDPASDLTVDDTPGSGTWSYSLFIEYNDGSQVFSSARTVTAVVA